MANQIKLKNGSGSDPSASDLVVGEVALRTDNASLFTKKDDGTIAEIGAAAGVSDGDKGDITVSNSGATFTIDDGVVSRAKIADDAVDHTKLATGAANTAAIGNGAVTTAKIDDSAITSAKIADGTIVNADINASAAIARTKLANVDLVDDTSPQLGNSLDMNGQSINGGDSAGTTSNRIKLGSGDDLQLYHNGTDSFLQNYTGNLKLAANSLLLTNKDTDETYISCTDNGAVELYEDNDKRLETTSTGVRIPLSNNQDGLEFFSSGDIYPRVIGNTNRTLGDKFLLSLEGIWNNNHTVAKISIETGDDTTNKDDGRIVFHTATSNGTVAERFRIEPFGNVQIPADNKKLQIGASQDLELFHNGSNSVIADVGEGNLSLQTNGSEINCWNSTDGEYMARFKVNGAVELYHGMSGSAAEKKFETTSIGATLNTILTLTGAAGNPGRLRLQEGGALSEIMVGRNSDSSSFLYFKTEISGTTATRALIDESGHFRPNVDSTNDLGITGTRWRNVYADTLYGAGSNITALNASNISSGTVAAARLDTATTQSAGNNTTKIATTAFVSTAISNLIDSSPGTLNTLNELAAALGDDASFSTTVTNSIATKMPLAGGTFSGDVTFNGGASAITIEGNSDIRFNNSSVWTGDSAGKIQLYSNWLYLSTGSNGIVIRGNSGVSDRWYFRSNGHFEPAADSAYDIGANAARVRNGYFDTLYGDGSNLTNLPSQTDQNFTNADHSKLDGIEANATADQTAAEIRTLVGNASDSNVFTDALLSKLNGIAASATNVTNNNQLTNGAGYITESFPSGTRMIFQQTSAPTGWTKDTTDTNQRALRVVSGTASSGGSMDFTTAFATHNPSGVTADTTQGGTVASGGNNTNNTSQETNSTSLTTNSTTQGGSIANGGNNTNSGGNNTNSTTQGGSVNNHTLSEGQMPTHRHTVKTTNSDSNSVGSQGYPANDNHSCPRTTDRSRNRNINANTLLQAGSSSSHSHGFSGSSHSHTINSHTHSINAHSHGFTGSSHTHTVDAHHHGVPNHSHTITSHSHGFSGSAHNHTFTGTAIQLAVKYLDVIIASKD